jgi:large subunit ribosomal protein L17
MRHGKKVNHLGRTKSHRDALLSNLATSLLKAKRIQTTLAKAKALRVYIEPLITKGKNDTTHSRRVVFSYLQDKESINLLFGEIAEKVAERNGGYTRIIKLGQRQGDNAQIALIELVDYNENLLTSVDVEDETKTKRSRRGKSKKGAAETVAVSDAPMAVEAVSESVVDESSVEEVIEEVSVVADETTTQEEANGDVDSTSDSSESTEENTDNEKA